MARVYAQFAGLDQIGTQCASVASGIHSVRADLKQTIKALDWDVRYESNINDTANKICQKLDDYEEILKEYKRFIDDVRREYVELDEYKQLTLTVTPSQGSGSGAALGVGVASATVTASGSESGLEFDYDWTDILKGAGSGGKLFGSVIDLFQAETWLDVGKAAVSATDSISKIVRSYNNYSKIGRAIGTKNATAYFLNDILGFKISGYNSKAKSVTARFSGNLTNKTSANQITKAFDDFVGKNGTVSTVAAWAGVALSGITNAFSNIEEQKASEGTMSTERVVAETVVETAIDTLAATASTAVVGAALAAAGIAAAPVAVAAVAGLAVVGINAGVEALTGKSATEWVSDAVVDVGSAVCGAVSDGAKAVADWFGKLSLF